MTRIASSLSLLTLYRLGEQIEQDNSASVEELRARDRAIGTQCQADDDVSRLLFWLKQLPQAPTESAHTMSEHSVAYIVRIVAAVVGFASMTGYLLSGEKMVNVFTFFLIFVVMQLIFCFLSLAVIYRSVKGAPPVITLPISPIRYLVTKTLPDKRFYTEILSVIRILVLRYGQEMGVIFTLGAIIAFFIVLFSSGFIFVWGSTFPIADSLVKDLTDIASAPWSQAFSSAVVSSEIIELSQYQQGITKLDIAEIKISRQWWPFLIMSMCVYALLPRTILWAVTKWLYRREMHASLLGYPGSDRILKRMKSPLVTTAGEPAGEFAGKSHSRQNAEIDPDLAAVDWAGALGFVDGDRFEELEVVSPDRIITAGVGSLNEDIESIDQISNSQPRRLMVIVKAWEPPMADLREFLSDVNGVSHCTLCLLPLKNKQISKANIADWTVFSRALSIDVVDVITLERSSNTES